MGINERILKAACDETEFESLLKEYRPFIASCASRTVGRYIDEHDDEMSIAIIAFTEAVRGFRPKSGKFLPFASNVIRCRLIDDIRKKERNIKTVSLNDDSEDEEDIKNSLRFDNAYDDPVKLEIEALTADLKKYGFGFMDIVKCSPKHKRTKHACALAAKCIIESADIQTQLKQTKHLPIQRVEIITNVSRKTIERHRNYIVCLAEILLGEYAYLSEYVKFVKEA